MSGGHMPQIAGAGGARARGGGSGSGLFSLRSISNYLRVVSSGASTVASTVRSAGASVASIAADNNGGRDQVQWAGFDKLECGGDVLRQVLLLGYRSGFQVWDVEEGDDVRQLVSRNDDPVSFLQIQKRPIASKRHEDQFGNVRPLLVVAVDGSFSSSGNNFDGGGLPCSGDGRNCQELVNDGLLPTSVRFYSLKSHEYVHVLKFRSPVYSIRCSHRVVAVSQAAQIHLFSAASLEKEFTILTCPIVPVSIGSGVKGCGPLALGSRWLAYSGSPVAVSDTGRVSPEYLTSGTGLSSLSNGSMVAHYAKESSKQLAAGIVTLGDMGYKKLSKYLPDNNASNKDGNSSFKTHGTTNGHLPDTENIGMVIVRDVVSKAVVVQFRAHKSPISVLSFDPSGTLLVTASIHGHNINVYRIMPSLSGNSPESDATGSCAHLYKLQRGITNAIIQDISFSDNSQWIMISSSRGTSHLFSVSLSGGNGDVQSTDTNFMNYNYSMDLAAGPAACLPHNSSPSKPNRQSFFPSGSPITLSVVSRIKNGSNGWKGAVTGAAAAATGRVSPLTGAIASVFHNCKSSGVYSNMSSMRTNYYLLVFSPSGCIIQYVLRHSSGEDSGIDLSGLSTISDGSLHGIDSRLVVEPLQKWDVWHKRNRNRGDNVDVYGEHGNGESTKVFQKGMKRGTSIYPSGGGANMKVKPSAEENHHMYISEVELNMHTTRVPLWTKSKIQFHVLVAENITLENSASPLGGEINIERIPTRIVEARTKDLVPVFDYMQTPTIVQSRTNNFDTNKIGLLVGQKSSTSEDGRLSRGSSNASLECATESLSAADYSNSSRGGYLGEYQPSSDANEAFINSGTDFHQLNSVNNGEGLKIGTQLEHASNEEVPGDEDPI